MNEKIERFVSKRPDVVAAYGYGSGIFKQSGYSEKDKPQIDLIFVVEDLKKWHLENMKLNRKDYSLTGRVFFKNAKVETLKGKTGITYVSNISENGNIYKYGTIEERDLIRYLDTWKSFYLPGRLQKNVYPIKESEVLKEKIEYNRQSALLLSAFLSKKSVLSRKEFYEVLCSLSYLGDTRMKIAENPRKVLNIVEGSFDSFNKIYKFDKRYFKNTFDEDVIINKEEVREDLNKLPGCLAAYIENYLDKDDDVIRERIIDYFTELNKKESFGQTVKGIFTNGICRSVNYASKKVLKRIKK